MDSNFELEELTKNIVDEENKYLIWGAGVAGKRFYEKYNKMINVIGFIDSDEAKKNIKIYNLPIIRPEDLTKQNNIKVIICVLGYYDDIEKQLIDKYYIANEDFFYEKEFITIYEFYKNGILNLWHLNLHITEKCTLKCKDCSALIPYISNPQNILLEKIYEDLNAFFSKVDFVQELHLIGGEPMIYPQLAELIEFIGNNYRSRIGEFAIATNGTMIPDENLIKMSFKHKVLYIISDYTKSDYFNGVQNGEKLNQLLLSEKIETRYSNKNTWLDFGNPQQINLEFQEKEQKYRFRKCRTLNRVLRNGKLYYCHHNLGAILAKYTDEESSGYIDLKDWDLITKKEILSFDLGFIKKDYLKFCIKCNGYEGLNSRKIPAAKQLKNIAKGD